MLEFTIASRHKGLIRDEIIAFNFILWPLFAENRRLIWDMLTTFISKLVYKG